MLNGSLRVEALETGVLETNPAPSGRSRVFFQGGEPTSLRQLSDGVSFAHCNAQFLRSPYFDVCMLIGRYLVALEYARLTAMYYSQFWLSMITTALK